MNNLSKKSILYTLAFIVVLLNVGYVSYEINRINELNNTIHFEQTVKSNFYQSINSSTDSVELKSDLLSLRELLVAAGIEKHVSDNFYMTGLNLISQLNMVDDVGKEISELFLPLEEILINQEKKETINSVISAVMFFILLSGSSVFVLFINKEDESKSASKTIKYN